MPIAAGACSCFLGSKEASRPVFLSSFLADFPIFTALEYRCSFFVSFIFHIVVKECFLSWVSN